MASLCNLVLFVPVFGHHGAAQRPSELGLQQQTPASFYTRASLNLTPSSLWGSSSSSSDTEDHRGALSHSSVFLLRLSKALLISDRVSTKAGQKKFFNSYFKSLILQTFPPTASLCENVSTEHAWNSFFFFFFNSWMLTLQTLQHFTLNICHCEVEPVSLFVTLIQRSAGSAADSVWSQSTASVSLLGLSLLTVQLLSSNTASLATHWLVTLSTNISRLLNKKSRKLSKIQLIQVKYFHL